MLSGRSWSVPILFSDESSGEKETNWKSDHGLSVTLRNLTFGEPQPSSQSDRSRHGPEFGIFRLPHNQIYGGYRPQGLLQVLHRLSVPVSIRAPVVRAGRGQAIASFSPVSFTWPTSLFLLISHNTFNPTRHLRSGLVLSLNTATTIISQRAHACNMHFSCRYP